MRRAALFGLAMICVAAAWRPAPISALASTRYAGGEADVMAWTQARMEQDIEAVRRFRPGFTFWQYVFTTPDGSVIYASAQDGRVIARFPENGDWLRGARFEEGALSSLLTGQSLARRLTDRRDQVAALLEDQVGPVVHNPTPPTSRTDNRKGRLVYPANGDRNKLDFSFSDPSCINDQSGERECNTRAQETKVQPDSAIALQLSKTRDGLRCRRI